MDFLGEAALVLLVCFLCCFACVTVLPWFPILALSLYVLSLGTLPFGLALGIAAVVVTMARFAERIR